MPAASRGALLWCRRAPRHVSSQAYATAAAGQPIASVFDRRVKLLQRERAASRKDLSRLTDYVRDEVAQVMADRLLDIKRRYETILDIGSGAGFLVRHMDPEATKKVIMLDSSPNMLHRDTDESSEPIEVERIVRDEEDLRLGEDQYDAIISSCALHWVNDLPGSLIQIRRALKPDGVLLLAMIGGETLFELRTSLQLAEVEREGGISPRVSPMTDSRSMSSLLNRAGFTLPTVDVDELQIAYPSIFELVSDLRAMGESNAALHRRSFLHRDTLLAAAAIYNEMHGRADGSIPATYSLVYAIGWKPGPNQPKALQRGSAETSLKDVLEGKRED